MFKCKICDKIIELESNHRQHTKKCEKINLLKNEIIDLYLNQNFSVKDLRKKYKIQSTDIKDVLGNKVRSQSEASILSHKKYPDKFKHSDETKKKLSKIRLDFMKKNPNKTAWRLSNLSYPEKLFVEYVEKEGINKKYSIIREYSVFPYFIDFAFINEMIAIEIDGSQHLIPDRKKRDDKKDKLLNDLGWSVIRISEKEIKTNIKNVFLKIISILEKKIKVNNFKIGIIVNPKKNIKKERNFLGYTESQYNSFVKQRKVDRPSYEELKKLVKKHGYKKTGSFYGVSDNSIRKWIKFYEKTNK